MNLKDCILLFMQTKMGENAILFALIKIIIPFQFQLLTINQVKAHRFVWLLLHKQHAEREAYAVDCTN
jgi:hypothetical protein